jgi:hypothetical protein
MIKRARSWPTKTAAMPSGTIVILLLLALAIAGLRRELIAGGLHRASRCAHLVASDGSDANRVYPIAGPRLSRPPVGGYMNNQVDYQIDLESEMLRPKLRWRKDDIHGAWHRASSQTGSSLFSQPEASLGIPARCYLSAGLFTFALCNV